MKLREASALTLHLCLGEVSNDKFFFFFFKCFFGCFWVVFQVVWSFLGGCLVVFGVFLVVFVLFLV